MGLQKTSQEIIQSLLASEIYVDGEQPVKKKEKTLPNVPLVTVSRAFGCGATDIARLLAQRLQVRVYDKELLAEVIKAAKADKYMMANLDERVPNWMEEVIASIFSKKTVSNESFYQYLFKVILAIGRTGGIIVGRGAHLMLQHHRPFRLRLDGSPDLCAVRVADRMGMKKGKAEKLVEKVDAERDEFLKKLSRKFPGNSLGYDLMINTDSFTPAQVVAIVVSAMQTLGYQLPAEPAPENAPAA